MLIRQWMHSNVVSVRPTTSLLKCKSLLHEYHIQQLPVVDAEKNVVGIISSTDISNFSPHGSTGLEILEVMDILDETPASQIMTKEPRVIDIDSTVGNAASIMAEYSVRCLPVVEGRKLVGIITEWDIFKIFVNITGARKTGLQMCFDLENKPGTLRAKLDILRNQGARALSVLTNFFDEDTKRTVTLHYRLQSESQKEELLRALNTDGSMVYWAEGEDIHLIKK